MNEDQINVLVRSACAGFAEGLINAITRLDRGNVADAGDVLCDESEPLETQAGHTQSECDEWWDGEDNCEVHGVSQRAPQPALDPEILARAVSEMTEQVPMGFFDPMAPRDDMTPWLAPEAS